MNLVGRIQAVPKVDETLTKDGAFADAKVVGDKFTEMDKKKVNVDDIVNNLTTDDAKKPLASGMGKELKNQIDNKKAEGVIYDNSKSGLVSKYVQGAIDELKELHENFKTEYAENNEVDEIALWVEPNVRADKSVCYRCGKVCTFVFDFTTNQEISANGVPIFADLPKPKANYTFEVHCMSDKTPYWLGVYDRGIISTAYVSNIPAETRLFGTFTYIAE